MNEIAESAVVEPLLDSMETRLALVAATVPVVRVIDFSLIEGKIPSLLVTAMGEAYLGPWAQVQLVPRAGLFPGPDGFFEFDFRGLRGTRKAGVPFVVAANYRWQRFALDNAILKGVRVRGANGRLMDKLFAELATW